MKPTSMATLPRPSPREAASSSTLLADSDVFHANVDEGTATTLRRRKANTLLTPAAVEERDKDGTLNLTNACTDSDGSIRVAARWRKQLVALIQKNWKIMERHKTSTIAEVLVPLQMIFWLYLISFVFVARSEHPESDDAHSVVPLKAFARHIALIVAHNSTYPAYFASALKVDNATAFPTFGSAALMKRHYRAHPLSILYAVDFTQCPDKVILFYNETLRDGRFSHTLDYVPFLQGSVDPGRVWLDNNVLELQNAAQHAMVAHELGGRLWKDRVYVEAPPEMRADNPSCDSARCVSQQLAFPVTLGLTFAASAHTLLVAILHEKESGFFSSMQHAGMYIGAYYLSWAASKALFLLMPVSVVLIACYTTSVIHHSSVSVVMVYLYGMALASTTFNVVLACALRHTRSAGHCGSACTALGTCAFFMVQNGMIRLDNARLAVIMTFGVHFVPAGLFASEIAELESRGVGVHWQTLGEYGAPALVMLYVDCLIHLLGAIYIAHVFPGDGAPHHPLYFLTRTYWKQGKTDATVRSGVEVDNVFKTFHSTRQGVVQGNAPKTILALNGISFSLHPGAIHCLLGHNGAGKTTLIQCMTGRLVPTSGRVRIGSVDARRAQRCVGVCAQHDVLSDHLTAAEHIALFSALRGLDPRAKDGDELLAAVHLAATARASTQVGHFSAGMKRRLSVCLALLGSPSFVLLDEPSSGVDPVNRRRLWALLQARKHTMTLLLTTHSMEEAEMLGDRVFVMSNGRMKHTGTPIELKHAYGIGYHLHLFIASSAAQNAATDIVRAHVPQMTIRSCSRNDMTCALPLYSVPQFPRLFHALARCPGAHSVSLSMTTLEDAFLDVEEALLDPSPATHALSRDTTAGPAVHTADVAQPTVPPVLGQLRGAFQLCGTSALRDRSVVCAVLVMPVCATLLVGFLFAFHDPRASHTTLLHENAFPEYMFPAAFTDNRRCFLGVRTYPKFTSDHALYSYVRRHDSARKGRGPASYVAAVSVGVCHETRLLLNTNVAQLSILANALYQLYHKHLEASGIVQSVQFTELPKHSVALDDTGGSKDGDIDHFFVGGAMIFISASFAVLSGTFGEHMVHMRTSGLKHLLIHSGVSPRHYVVAQFLLHVVQFFVPALCTVVFMTVCGLPVVHNNHIVGILLLYGTAAPGIIFFGHAVSRCFSSLSAAQEWLHAIVQFVVGLPWLFQYFSTARNSNHWWNTSAYMWVPALPGTALYRGMALLQHAGLTERPYSTVTDLFDAQRPLAAVFMTQVATGMFWAAIVYTCETRLPRQRQPRPPGLPADHTSDGAPYTQHPLDVEHVTMERACGSRTVTSCDDITVRVSKGAIYGLLGLNGSGKTTLLSVITGEVAPTSGSVRLAGHYLWGKTRTAGAEGTESDALPGCNVPARAFVGYCSQFDRFFPTLTAREALTAIAIVRGIPHAMRDQYVAQLLRTMALTAKADEYACTYSGGQKRTLCVAQCMVGRRPIMCLDEPTTGLDTNTRRNIWKAILELKKHSAVVLTTHSMEEADALSTRLGILVKGKIKVEGSAQELKQRYGSGYVLTIRGRSRRDITECVSRVFPDAQLVTCASSCNHHVFQVPANVLSATQIATFFETIEDAKSAYEIHEYGLTQTTLDHVFLNFNVEEEKKST